MARLTHVRRGECGASENSRRRHDVEFADLSLTAEELVRAAGLVVFKRHGDVAVEAAHIADRDGLAAVEGFEASDTVLACFVVNHLLRRNHRDEQLHLGRYDHDVGRHSIPSHARLGLLDGNVEAATAQLLHKGKGLDLTLHLAEEVVLRQQALCHVIVPVVVVAREVSIEHVEIRRLLDAVLDGLDGVGKILAASLTAGKERVHSHTHTLVSIVTWKACHLG